MSRQPRADLARIAPYTTVDLQFHQNSTRTMISCQAATSLLGGKYAGFADAKTTRAGNFFTETLEDTVRVLSCHTDLLMLRHVDDTPANAQLRWPRCQ
ncbi:hypothetical protein [Sphaerimonospora mesophila]|uniref:hypothetical protein n=1 Tax=Sphaerimonospora mesophila TaxID=37483 RepID=UPI0006E1B678